MNQGASTVWWRQVVNSTGVNGSGLGTSAPSSMSRAYTSRRQLGSLAISRPSVVIATPAASARARSGWNRERSHDATSSSESHVRMTSLNPRAWTNRTAWARSSFTSVRTASASRARSDCCRRSQRREPIPRPHRSGNTRMVIPNFRGWKFQGRWRTSPYPARTPLRGSTATCRSNMYFPRSRWSSSYRSSSTVHGRSGTTAFETATTAS